VNTNQDTIPLSRPDITDAEVQAVLAVLRSDRLSIGPCIEEFETAVATRAGRQHGIAVNSGTSGLHLCVRAIGLGPDDEVVTSPFSFISTTNCLLFERATPVFADIDLDTYNMSPEAVEAAITPHTKALLPVEAFGNTAHFDAYEQIAEKHGIPIIEDCCEALGGSLHGRPAGSFGVSGVFGFYPNKQITTGEGGVIVTDDDDIAAQCRSMRNQGRSREDQNTFERLGYNYRMTELSAAMGVAQMDRLGEILHQRREVARWYSDALADIDEISPPVSLEPDHASWFVYVVRLADRLTGEQRNGILQKLNRRGVACQAYFSAIHLQPYIRDAFGFRRGDFPLCERAADRTIVLPFFTSMEPQQVHRVADALKSALSEY